jgi:hypothetical protein
LKQLVDKRMPHVDAIAEQFMNDVFRHFRAGVHPTEILAALALALHNLLDYASERGTFSQSPYKELHEVLKLALADLALRAVKPIPPLQ